MDYNQGEIITNVLFDVCWRPALAGLLFFGAFFIVRTIGFVRRGRDS